ncbi:hypothetical protein JHK82_034128 [Glycine max]|uniref:Uncharacterized protein n=1 Tax=Glycine max TaxID=3847 RepID=A0A0R0HGL7_SOYBN|nr:hypothetical protein JHK85_034841 [Glycine max]KAG4986506.1 hypothetical protein JHK86_034197 [Glycine max]KAG5119708.1 hypothetical protein JHK82_034128 [Glycine max]KAG5140699.1 hypothetical protein JHK84_034467 [Glycine max]KAH1143517.1 hypothetical protein GYH30_033989 [Glycine max]
MGASSQMIRLASFNNSANCVPWWILHVESSKIGIGILNFECVVLPPSNNKEAMPLEATIIINLLSALNELASAFQMNVFPVPLYLYRKNMPPSF